ncbi:MAG: lipid IV(A) 3-deoxy-D-manno-octulosonic acid transferase [Rhizobiaceae bacterium]|nr:lipid IV(A) 3-deoxy-D-manno-octulosonic acid transferase [Rhizobiaceae bacterium]
MNTLFTRVALKTYRAIGLAVYPFMGPLLRFRASRGKEDRKRRYERYGYPSADKPSGPMIWFHAASVGESMAILPLIEHVNGLGINTIITTGTVTSAQIVRKRLPPSSFHQYVPLDLKPALERFLDHWRPDVAIFTESEIWPMTLLELANRKIPRILVNARMSDRSYKRWKNASGLAESLFDTFSHVIAQSQLDGDRFSDLGARPVNISGNLKVDTGGLPFDDRELKRIAARIGNRPCWVAASTHEGEEEAIGKIHLFLKNRMPDLLTIVVPRHPDRAPGLVALLRENGLGVSQRSQNEAIDAKTDIYMGDTMGEMGLYLRLAQVAFVGKSLKAQGGQNPLEPAMTGTPIISGQAVQNFRDAYSSLLEADAVRLVADEKMLAANLEYLLKNPAERAKMAANAQKTLEEMRGALNKTVHILDSYLFPLTIKRDLESLNNGTG